MQTPQDLWCVGDIAFSSRFLLGTARYPSPAVLREAMRAAGSQIVTVGLKRQTAASGSDNGFIDMVRQALRETGARLLPNTAGCASAREAVQLAHMARELYDTPWIKLEVIGDDYTLQPDPQELVRAAAELVREGFTVFPYCTDDLVTCRRLLDAGSSAPARASQTPLPCACCASACLRPRSSSTRALARPATPRKPWKWALTPCCSTAPSATRPTRCAWQAPSARPSRRAAPRTGRASWPSRTSPCPARPSRAARF